MDSFKKQFSQWRFLQDISRSYTPNKVYESVPSLDDHEDGSRWRRRASSTGPGDSHLHTPSSPSSAAAGTPMLNLLSSSSPTDRFPSSRTPESHSHNYHRASIFSARLLSTAMLLNALRFLRPSFLSSSHGVNSNKPYKIQATTYLNGVRGFAALCVYFQHFLVKYFKYLDEGYLSGPDENRILQLPYIRLLFTGRFMVANFFILSGFVLSCKPLRLIRKRDASLLDCLTSSTFRRAPRLFLPLIPPMIFTAFCNYFHWYVDHPEVDVIDPNKQYPSLPSRLSEEFYIFMDLINPFTWSRAYPGFTPHFWTLPMEFRGSMVVFVSLLCLAKAKAMIRVFLLGALACYSLQKAHWEIFLFVSGILVAEFHLIQKESAYSLEDFLRFINLETKETAKYATIFSHVFWSLVFAFGLFLGSWPCNNAAKTPGLITLNSLTPHHFNSEELRGYFWYSIGAVMIMMAFENLPILQRPFTTAFARYLGDISYAFYIIHWTFLWTIGRLVTNETISLFGKYYGFGIGTIIVFPLTICVADVYWRMFDNGSVNLARWLWIKCSVSESQGSSSRALEMQPNTASTVIGYS